MQMLLLQFCGGGGRVGVQFSFSTTRQQPKKLYTNILYIPQQDIHVRHDQFGVGGGCWESLGNLVLGRTTRPVVVHYLHLTRRSPPPRRH